MCCLRKLRLLITYRLREFVPDQRESPPRSLFAGANLRAGAMERGGDLAIT
jgi:hypothetical protein